MKNFNNNHEELSNFSKDVTSRLNQTEANTSSLSPVNETISKGELKDFIDQAPDELFSLEYITELAKEEIERRKKVNEDNNYRLSKEKAELSLDILKISVTNLKENLEDLEDSDRQSLVSGLLNFLQTFPEIGEYKLLPINSNEVENSTNLPPALSSNIEELNKVNEVNDVDEVNDIPLNIENKVDEESDIQSSNLDNKEDINERETEREVEKEELNSSDTPLTTVETIKEKREVINNNPIYLDFKSDKIDQYILDPFLIDRILLYRGENSIINRGGALKAMIDVINRLSETGVRPININGIQFDVSTEDNIRKTLEVLLMENSSSFTGFHDFILLNSLYARFSPENFSLSKYDDKNIGPIQDMLPSFFSRLSKNNPGFSDLKSDLLFNMQQPDFLKAILEIDINKGTFLTKTNLFKGLRRAIEYGIFNDWDMSKSFAELFPNLFKYRVEKEANFLNNNDENHSDNDNDEDPAETLTDDKENDLQEEIVTDEQKVENNLEEESSPKLLEHDKEDKKDSEDEEVINNDSVNEENDEKSYDLDMLTDKLLASLMIRISGEKGNYFSNTLYSKLDLLAQRMTFNDKFDLNLSLSEFNKNFSIWLKNFYKDVLFDYLPNDANKIVLMNNIGNELFEELDYRLRDNIIPKIVNKFLAKRDRNELSQSNQVILEKLEDSQEYLKKIRSIFQIFGNIIIAGREDILEYIEIPDGDVPVDMLIKSKNGSKSSLVKLISFDLKDTKRKNVEILNHQQYLDKGQLKFNVKSNDYDNFLRNANSIQRFKNDNIKKYNENLIYLYVSRYYSTSKQSENNWIDIANTLDLLKMLDFLITQ